MEKHIYLVIAFYVVCIDFLLAYFTYKSKKEKTRYFTMTLILLGFMEFFYTLTFFVGDNYFLAKLTMGIFFAIIPIMLLILLLHIMYYTGVTFKRKQRILINIAGLICGIDFLMELLNPWTEWVIQFKYDGSLAFPWLFQNKLWYDFHVYVLCYILILIMVVYISRKIMYTPRVYRRKYYTIILGLVVCIGLNFICLWFQNMGMLDYSQLSYSICAFIMYWDIFHNRQQGMLNAIRQVVLDEIGQAVILFGEENSLASMNKEASFLVPNWKQGDIYSLSTFLKEWGFDSTLETSNDNSSFLMNYKQYTYRVDFRVICDDQNLTIGRLFVFTDTSLAYDLLTEFHTRDSFERYIQNQALIFSNASIAICDINSLSLINKTYGEDIGDRCIVLLAKKLKEECTKDSYFVRMNDANLMVISPNVTSKEMHACLEKVREYCHNMLEEPKNVDIQYAVSVTNKENPDLDKAIDNARKSMKIQKLMDPTSAHSSLLDSLAQALIENDELTEAHVNRTRIMGEELGKRLNFTDLQLSNLSLLCLLHDIGKVGIPLEILNKPAKLDSYEWKIMKSHVEKGYRIAKASEELAPIAECILYHHESWDGTGYPFGLSKESIPILSRIIAIVDAYDAMTNNRPYHQAISKEAACEELRRCAGKQFDPYITSQFLAMITDTEVVTSMEQKVESFTKNEYKNTNIHKIPIGEIVLNSTGKILSVNEAFKELTGYTDKDILDFPLTLNSLIPPRDLEDVCSLIADKEDTLLKGMELRIQRKGGMVRNVIGSGSLQPDGSVILHVVDLDQSRTVQKIREQEEEKRVHQIDVWGNILRRDSLTGLYNHEAFVNNVEEEILKNKHLIFIILDVDDFKKYNDSYGHMAGDALLTCIAKLLEEKVSIDGFAGRLGGDELAAVFTIENIDYSKYIAKNRVKVLFEEISKQLQALPQGATISMGAVHANKEINSFRYLYQSADLALYESKKKGRNQLTYYEDIE